MEVAKSQMRLRSGRMKQNYKYPVPDERNIRDLLEEKRARSDQDPGSGRAHRSLLLSRRPSSCPCSTL